MPSVQQGINNMDPGKEELSLQWPVAFTQIVFKNYIAFLLNFLATNNNNNNTLLFKAFCGLGSVFTCIILLIPNENPVN